MFLELRTIFWKIPVSLEARKQGTNLSLFFILSSAPTGPLSTVRMTDSYQSALEVVHMRGKKGHTSQYVKACFIFNKFYDATRFIDRVAQFDPQNIGEMFLPLASFLVYCRVQFHTNASCFISVNFRRLDKSKVRKFKYSFSCSVVY